MNDDCMDAVRYALYTDRAIGVPTFDAFTDGEDRDTGGMDF